MPLTKVGLGHRVRCSCFSCGYQSRDPSWALGPDTCGHNLNLRVFVSVPVFALVRSHVGLMDSLLKVGVRGRWCPKAQRCGLTNKSHLKATRGRRLDEPVGAKLPLQRIFELAKVHFQVVAVDVAGSEQHRVLSISADRTRMQTHCAKNLRRDRDDHLLHPQLFSDRRCVARPCATECDEGILREIAGRVHWTRPESRASCWSSRPV